MIRGAGVWLTFRLPNLRHQHSMIVLKWIRFMPKLPSIVMMRWPSHVLWSLLFFLSTTRYVKSCGNIARTDCRLSIAVSIVMMELGNRCRFRQSSSAARLDSMAMYYYQSWRHTQCSDPKGPSHLCPFNNSPCPVLSHCVGFTYCSLKQRWLKSCRRTTLRTWAQRLFVAVALQHYTPFSPSPRTPRSVP